MDSVALVARMLLAIAFAAAAAAKLADQRGVRNTLGAFGAPEAVRASSALLLPLAELATAAALLISRSARWGAIAAIGLLVVFSGAVALAMTRGRQPDCHCFGRLSSGSAGARTLVRNGFLAIPAALVIIHGPGPGIGHWIQARSAAELVATAATIGAVALAALSLQLWRENRRLRGDLSHAEDAIGETPSGLAIGSPAPDFELPDLHGRPVPLGALLGHGRAVALVFVSGDCGGCTRLLPSLARWQATLADRLTIAPIAAGGASDGRRLADEYDLQNVLLEEDGEVMRAYRAAGTPSVAIVAANGTVASRTTPTAFMVESLIRRALHRVEPARDAGAPSSHETRLAVQHFGGPVGAR